MIFSSLTFIYAFFPIVILLYFLFKNRTYRNCILLLASTIFYAWGEPKYILVMLCSVFSAYIGGLLISYFDKKCISCLKKTSMIVTLFILVGILLIFKYLNLFVDTFHSILSVNITIKKIVLPIGISFYTFQILSYIIDLYRGKVKLQKNFFTLLLYVSFFPQLIAGPIVRYETIESELKNRKENWNDFTSGLEVFIFGLAKKVLLANNLAKLADGIYAMGIEKMGTLFTWLAVIAYTFQIYFDFSGYSDMAIGLGRIFGFHFPQNFYYPYIATSITDFWRRWHISLSTWFRDYIYIPLGGNRVAPFRHVFNILITWALTGFWHGAQWNFLLWGLYYALLLLIEKYFFAKLLKKIPAFIQWVYTFLLVSIGWVIFSKESIHEILSVLKNMFMYTASSPLDIIASNSQLVPAIFVLPFAIVFSFPLFKKFMEGNSTFIIIIREALCLLLFALCIISLLSSTYNPFIYFRF